MANYAIIMPIRKQRVLPGGTSGIVESDLWGIEVSDDHAYAQTCIFQRDEIMGMGPAELLELAEHRTNEVATEIIRRAKEGDSGLYIGRKWYDFDQLEPSAPKAG